MEHKTTRIYFNQTKVLRGFEQSVFWDSNQSMTGDQQKRTSLMLCENSPLSYQAFDVNVDVCNFCVNVAG